MSTGHCLAIDMVTTFVVTSAPCHLPLDPGRALHAIGKGNVGMGRPRNFSEHAQSQPQGSTTASRGRNRDFVVTFCCRPLCILEQKLGTSEVLPHQKRAVHSLPYLPWRIRSRFWAFVCKWPGWETKCRTADENPESSSTNDACLALQLKFWSSQSPTPKNRKPFFARIKTKAKNMFQTLTGFRTPRENVSRKTPNQSPLRSVRTVPTPRILVDALSEISFRSSILQFHTQLPTILLRHLAHSPCRMPNKHTCTLLTHYSHPSSQPLVKRAISMPNASLSLPAHTWWNSHPRLTNIPCQRFWSRCAPYGGVG
ncbi:hypothetical protein BU24DRAFT_454819 [Aaosphaeria arxii CBS 175.79]|uniref:Uncharacterized protein n=1 Tax=Aaosphaeria arxii CBS 175.79 TaxID=1450172 RepID=A0A6A5XC28_9PLEO|nr:uncharacterized protein BU24DRAFT_454819 [Aaosphaeria arxii CBS 175.79]KAF2010451.1 hypothetical protein BU24DRAFT_454819 [Aaosphaeria arxii CBS 175.79]